MGEEGKHDEHSHGHEADCQAIVSSNHFFSISMNELQLEQLRTAMARIANLEHGRIEPSSTEVAVLGQVIPKIRKALLHDFESSIARYEVLRDALAQSGCPVATLTVCGRGTREIRYTQLLRYFLDPSQPHGLGCKFLQAFLAPELDAVDLTFRDVLWDKASVQAEFSLGIIKTGTKKIGSTVDLYVRAGDLVVLVENKIRSPESGAVGAGELSQLQRYSIAFAKHFPELQALPVVKVFLTPEGRSPKEDSDWIAVSHGDLLERLVQVLEDDTLSRVAKHNLASFMWDLMCGPLAFGGRTMAELTARLSSALEDSDKSIPLRAWCSRNVPYFDIMLRTVEVCNE